MIYLFGDKLKELRTSKKISQEGFGELFGVSKGTISSWESSRTEPPYEIMLEIAKYFGVTPNYLFDFTQEDMDRIEQLRTALKNAGVDNIEQAMQIIEILKKEKDAKK